MKRIWLLLVLLGLVSGAAFLSGGYCREIRSTAANASYRAIFLQAALHDLRQGNSGRGTFMLEMALDENIAALAELQRTPDLVRRLAIPAWSARQGDEAISRFVRYRTNIGTNYNGVPLLVETDQVKWDRLDDVNRNRARINRLVAEVMKRNPTSGRSLPSPAAGSGN